MVVGIIRKLDALGRITLPREYRRYLELNIGDEAEMILEENEIRIRPVKRSK